MGVVVISTYRPKPGMEDGLLREVKTHLPMLREQGRVTDRESIRTTVCPASIIPGAACRWSTLTVLLLLVLPPTVTANDQVVVSSPDRSNVIELRTDDGRLTLAVTRNGCQLFAPSPAGFQLGDAGRLDDGVRIVDVQRGKVDESFPLPWGKTTAVTNRCSSAVVTLVSDRSLRWQVDLRAYNDGVAFRYRILPQQHLAEIAIADEVTEFAAVGEPQVLYNTLDSFTTSHESLYDRSALDALPVNRLMDCPALLVWPNGVTAAITEARVRHFAGMYLERTAKQNTVLRSRLSPLPSRSGICVLGPAPVESPWRVIMLADVAGKLLESNILLCLNDPPVGDFTWARPGKTTFHWWYGEFEDDHKLAAEREVYVARHRQYIDFCAENNIAYHTVSGDGLAWYRQSSTDYGTPAVDADVRVPRPELGLPEILEYARQKGVGIRLWVHWHPLNRQLEEAMSMYQKWGVKGLMIDFLDRDDQEMIELVDRMLECAARHKIHVQIHGSSKFSGEQRTWPHLFNREGVLNLEYVKWSEHCTPAHAVNVAWTRALAGPVDFHLGGFRAVSRANFRPRHRAPLVMGTRCHQMALYVVYENPMPMVADAPQAYTEQKGFEFIKAVPTTWDETRFITGQPGEYLVIARRHGNTWYLGGITNWTPRELSLPLRFLESGEFAAQCWFDVDDPSSPNKLQQQEHLVNSSGSLQVSMATGGGFVAILQLNRMQKNDE